MVFGESYMKSYLVLPEGHKCFSGNDKHDGQFISPLLIGLVWLLKEFVVAVRAWSYWTWLCQYSDKLAIGLCVDKSNNFISAKNHSSNRVLIIISSCFGGSLSRAIIAPQWAFRRNPSKFNWYLTDYSYHRWAGIVEIINLNVHRERLGYKAPEEGFGLRTAVPCCHANLLPIPNITTMTDIAELGTYPLLTPICLEVDDFIKRLE